MKNHSKNFCLDKQVWNKRDNFFARETGLVKIVGFVFYRYLTKL